MIMKKTKVTINERMLEKLSLIFLVLSVAMIVIAAKVDKPGLMGLGFLFLAFCFFSAFFSIQKKASGGQLLSLAMAELFFALSLLALYGVCSGFWTGEIITMGILGIVCLVFSAGFWISL